MSNELKFEGDFGYIQTTPSEETTSMISTNILNFSEYKGRRTVKIGVEEVNRGNALDVIELISDDFDHNRTQSKFLMDYYLGEQDILSRPKNIRPEINNTMVENRAKGIADFHVGYQFGSGIFYTSGVLDNNVGGELSDKTIEVDENVTTAISRINTINRQTGKSTADAEHLLDVQVTGRGYRFVEPIANADIESDYPYFVHAFDATASEMIYTNGAVGRELAFVYFSEIEDEEGNEIERYTIYTDKEVIVIDDEEINGQESYTHTLGVIPVVETQLNKHKVGVFESVLPLIEAINVVQSDRLNGVEQFIQSLLVLENIELDPAQFAALRREGGIQFTSTNDRPAKVSYLSNELNQSGTQLLKMDLINAVNELTAMPSRESVGGGTGDTGVAVELRDGWAAAETKAKSVDPYVYKAERKLVKLITICYNIVEGKGIEISPTSIEVKYNRNPRMDRYTSVQAMTEEIRVGIDPTIAIKGANIYDDPQVVADASMEAIIKIRDGNINTRENSPNTDVLERTDTETKTREEDIDE